MANDVCPVCQGKKRITWESGRSHDCPLCQGTGIEPEWNKAYRGEKAKANG